MINDISPVQFALLHNPNLYLMPGAVVSRVDTYDVDLLRSILPGATISKRPGSQGAFTCTVRVVK